MSVSVAEKRKHPRVPVQIPKPWHDLARELAADERMPTLWLFMTLLAEKAESLGKNHPPMPWEDEKPKKK